MVHVAYRLWGGEGFYAKMCGTSMLSIFENTNEKVTVHIMHNDRLTPDNRGKLCYIAGQYNQKIEFHNVEEIAGETLRKIEAVHPIKSGINAAWYPLIIHEVFPDLKKIIFMGTDTIFTLDVGELWNYDIGDYGIAAVPEILNGCPKNFFRVIVDGYVRHEDYFNVDVMVLKPRFFAEQFETILQGLKFVNDKRVESQFTAYLANEQDALSYLYSKNYFKLPGKFNSIMVWKRKFKQIPQNLEPAIYHYADPSSKPSLNIEDPWNKIYLEYFLKTPWINVDMFGNIFKECSRLYSENQQILLHFTNLVASRERSFIVDERTLDFTRQIFAVKNDEKVSVVSDVQEIEKIATSITNFKGKKIFFVLSSYWWPVRAHLLYRGFIEDIDFVNATKFLSKRNGEEFDFDSKSIVQEM